MFSKLEMKTELVSWSTTAVQVQDITTQSSVYNLHYKYEE